MSLKEITPDEVLARVLYRDGLMLIVDKPAGLPVHRGPKGGASLEDYFDALRFGLPRPPALAHRLDKDTSGCLVLGRHRKALAHLGLLFKHGKVGKTYWAVVEGGPDADEGTIALPLGRLDETRGWWMKPDPNGLPSVTTWKVLGRSSSLVDALRRNSAANFSPPPCGEGSGVGVGEWGTTGPQPPDPPPRPSPSRNRVYAGFGHSIKGSKSATADFDWGEGEEAAAPYAIAPLASVGGKMTWLALTPVTGRTHQLRVHCAASGWPIVGDNIYGTAQRFSEPTQQLHAREIVVPISKNKAPVRVIAPAPVHMRDLLRACGWNGEDQGI
jgi:tRNA pseudouridine32 synthase/23S rRNA pseudouridine746 synthase